MRQLDLDAWFSSFSEHTMRTEFVSVSQEEARVIEKGGSGVDLEKNGDLANLMHRIDAVVARFGGSAFGKMSSRSPKDATVNHPRTFQLYQKFLAEEPEKDGDAKLKAVNRAHIAALRVSGGRELLQLFLDSERIRDDLSLAFEQPDTWNQCVVIREWVDIPLSNEIRAFVYNRRLTALSQYYSVSVYPQLLNCKDTIELAIRKFVEQIVHLLPCDSVVMDIGVRSDGGVVLIEMNPFNDYEGCGTSAAMFDWSKDGDILFGRKPFEFRVETEKKPDAVIAALMGSEWRNLCFPVK